LTKIQDDGRIEYHINWIFCFSKVVDINAHKHISGYQPCVISSPVGSGAKLLILVWFEAPQLGLVTLVTGFASRLLRLRHCPKVDTKRLFICQNIVTWILFTYENLMCC